jgi:hypothetical protein
VNRIRNYGSTRWTDYDVVRLMLRSFTVIDLHLVNLISENPRYTKITMEEILENCEWTHDGKRCKVRG